MFLTRFFKAGFRFKEIFAHRHDKLYKYLIYFVLLSFVTLFPFNVVNYLNGGWKLGVIVNNLTSGSEIELVNGYDIEVNQNGVYTPNNNEFQIISKGDDGKYYYYHFNYQKDLSEYIDDGVNQVLFQDNMIVLIYENGSYLKGNYNGFDKTYSFREYKTMNLEQKKQFLNDFGLSVEEAFKHQRSFYTISMYTITQFATYVLLLLVLAGINMLFKFRYTDFLTYRDSIKVVILCMTVPTSLSFIISMTLALFGVTAAFSLVPTIFQLGTGIILMYVMIKHAGKEFS
ncbi:MAG: DUF1189 family protein [Acholeplasmataceae bacterium]|jgi:hypothetical protein